MSLGTRYQSYCANIARTYIINPSKVQESQYNALLAAQEAAIAALKEGAPAKASMEAAVKVHMQSAHRPSRPYGSVASMALCFCQPYAVSALFCCQVESIVSLLTLMAFSVLTRCHLPSCRPCKTRGTLSWQRS